MTNLQSLSTIAETRSVLAEKRSQGASIGLVPTMGYLHEGHLSLFRKAAEENDFVLATLFVNPLQFAPTEDLATYPSDVERDTELAAENGVHCLFAPSVAEMYPNHQDDQKVLTSIQVGGISSLWEGASRPTHFAGVTTVVGKIFNIVGPCNAYFGEKDFQQLAIIRQMAKDLSIPVTVHQCPIVRDTDGVALSSRNSYLTKEERQAATILNRSLSAGASHVAAGEKNPQTVIELMVKMVEAEPLAAIDYVTLVDPTTLEVPSTIEGEVRLLTAVNFGTTRLIDNQAARRK